MGVGSEIFGAVVNGRRGIGVELKEAYYRQAIKNMEHVHEYKINDASLFDNMAEAI